MTPNDPSNPGPVPITQDAFRALCKAANDGDQASLATLRSTLDNCPQIWQRIGDLAAHTERLLIDLIASGDVLARDSIERTIEQLRVDLAGSAPTAIEQVAVDRIIACWLQLQHADAVAAKTKGGTISNSKYVLSLQNSADRRYQAAVKSLTLVRKLRVSAKTKPLPAVPRQKPGPIDPGVGPPSIFVA